MKTKNSTFLAIVALLCALLMLVSCNSSAGNTPSHESGNSMPSGQMSDTSPKEDAPSTNTPSEIKPVPECKHESVIDPAVAPTCNEQGKTEGSHCSKCGKILKIQTKSPAKGHNYVGDSCSVCGYTPSKGLLYEECKVRISDGVILEGYCVSIGTCAENKINISDSYNGKPVLAIDDYGFAHDEIQSIHIPYSVVIIGEEAFYDCEELKSITLGYGITTIQSDAFDRCYLDSVYISDLEAWCQIQYKFYSSSPSGEKLYLNDQLLTEIVIPDSITAINEYAFYSIDSIKTVLVPDSVTTISDNAFSFCSNLEKITFGKNVTSIGSDAFEYCTSLSSITIPESVISIGSRAFSDCSNLSSIVISDNLKTIGSSAFYGTAYYNNSSNWKDSTLYLKNYLIRVEFEELYDDELVVENYTIKDGTVLIADGAFDSCDEVLKITIPDSVTTICSTAFQDCQNLKEISIPNSVKVIGKGILYDCDDLEILSTPFLNSTEEADFTLQYFFKDSFNGRVPESLKTVIITGGSEIKSSAFYKNCENITSIIISKSITTIESGTFGECEGLTDIWCEATKKPEGWDDEWMNNQYRNDCSATVHWGNEWEYVNGVPTIKK